jgi:hypothetical protein
MADLDISYANERARVTSADLATWTVDRDADTATGPCPKCGHTTESDLQSRAVAMRPGEAAQPAAMTRMFECRCNRPHADGATSRLTCGRWWLVRVQPRGQSPPIMPAGDDTMLGPAGALLRSRPDEETRVRTSAEKWIAGVTALLGLFGLAGIVTGKDALTGLDPTAKVVAAVLVLIAAGFAVAAVLLPYKAAYGWPTVVDVRTDEQLRAWFRAQRTKVEAAARNLQNGVVAAIAALVALILAVGVIWFWPAETAMPRVKVTLADDSWVCGELLDSKKNGELRIRADDGMLHPIAVGQVVKTANVSACATK